MFQTDQRNERSSNNSLECLRLPDIIWLRRPSSDTGSSHKPGNTRRVASLSDADLFRHKHRLGVQELIRLACESSFGGCPFLRFKRLSSPWSSSLASLTWADVGLENGAHVVGETIQHVPAGTGEG